MGSTMEEKEKTKKLSKTKTLILSLLVMAMFGSLYPFVKMGYQAFGINSSSVSDILLFAGMRFLVCGSVISIIASLKKIPLKTMDRKSFCSILWIGVFAIVLHYAFNYVGLATTDSSKSALIKQLGSLIYVCFAFLFFKNERFNLWKIFGAVIGFAGIVAINITSSGIVFAIGDILIVGASVCMVTSNIINKKTLENNSPFWITGISQLFGGAVLTVIALLIGVNAFILSWQSIGIFLYICTASIVSYLLFNYVLKTSDLSNMFIIKFAEPLFACVFGAIFLGENIFKWTYLLAFILISTGIALGNKEGKKGK